MDIQKKIIIFSERLELYQYIAKFYVSEYKVERYEIQYEWKDKFLEKIQVETALVVMDVERIIRDTLEWIRKIRFYGFTGNVLLVSRTKTRHLQIKEKISAIDAGADEYIEYPQTNEEIAASVKALLRRFTLKRSMLSIVSGKQFEINPQMRKIFMDGKEIIFTKMEYAILNYLFLHLNRTVSYKELYEAVWGKEYLHDDMNIMAHIHRIRKKMGDDTKNPQYIQNVYGSGYMIEGE